MSEEDRMKFKPDNGFNNVEYINLSKDGKQLYTFGEEVNGLSKVEFQKKVGELFGIGVYHCSMKVKKLFKNQTFQIRGIRMNSVNAKEIDSEKILSERIKELELKILDQSQNKLDGGSFERMEKLIAAKYEIEIQFLKERLEELKQTIAEYEKQFEKIENDSGNSSDLLGLLLNGSGLKNVFSPKTSTLKDSSSSENIPKVFLDLFSNLDYSKISESDQEQYANVLRQFTDKLPKKGS